MRTLLITGGCGFIGSNFIKRILRTQPNVKLVNLDSLTPSGNFDNLIDQVDNPKYVFINGDIRDAEKVREIIKYYHIDGIINFAAESDDYELKQNPKPFMETNVNGTLNLLEQALHGDVQRHHSRSFA